MRLSKKDLQLLKQYGFMWSNQGTTDRVDASCIEDVLPAANGFTVVYKTGGAIQLSTAVVHSIEFPEDMNRDWIRVNWTSIQDQKV